MTVTESTIPPFVINRTFGVPRQRKWEAWPERDRLMSGSGQRALAFQPTGTLD